MLLFAHRAAQQVCIAQRKSSQTVRNLHHLFLVEDHAPSLGQNLLQLRQIVGDFLLPVFAGDEIVNHAALNRAGAVERVERG